MSEKFRTLRVSQVNFPYVPATSFSLSQVTNVKNVLDRGPLYNTANVSDVMAEPPLCAGRITRCCRRMLPRSRQRRPAWSLNGFCCDKTLHWRPAKPTRPSCHNVVPSPLPLSPRRGDSSKEEPRAPSIT
jgi:hypothetical protein